jgi:hypothetical protein
MTLTTKIYCSRQYIPTYLKVKVTKLNEFWEFILLDHFNLL